MILFLLPPVSADILSADTSPLSFHTASIISLFKISRLLNSHILPYQGQKPCCQ
ncbi:hypothetical protein CCS77_1907 [Campylobacter concisus]|uniref:Uncharacterized protein n=1 Tax=Campylobacter concisus TaxID=199 RepID=A0A2R4P2Q3_9BACT|nr:hypothetical protein CCS77_1907 [Campylobacter concisus]